MILQRDLGFLLSTIQLNFHLFLFLIADTETSVSCVINQDCILPCRFKNGVTVMEWESKTSSLIVSYDHRGFSYSESFRSRASLFEDQISRGNGDLLLRGVKVDDEGRYRCTAKINGIYYTNLVVLPIEAPVSTFRIHQDGNRITCSSEGIYPQPELTWSTEPPSNTTLQNRTTVHQTEEKLYDISSSLTVPDCSDRIYSCTIRTQLTKIENKTTGPTRSKITTKKTSTKQTANKNYRVAGWRRAHRVRTHPGCWLGVGRHKLTDQLQERMIKTLKQK
uniref:Ig-like domain-containing protein n=1 Tax=Xiphophorus maculatus TaxID=8083 RepID=A0A3B5RA22_XIPMA